MAPRLTPRHCRSRPNSASGRRTALQRISLHHRRLAVECLEDRRLLSIDSPQLELFKISPALFVENQGQWSDPAVRYVHQGDGVNVAMTDTAVEFQVFRQQQVEGGPAATDALPSGLPGDGFGDCPDFRAGDCPDFRPTKMGLSPSEVPQDHQTEMLQFAASFPGAHAVAPTGADLSETQFNYFVGDPSQWHSGVPSYQQVVYAGLYDGIDLHTWGQRSHLKYEFHVAPGADYRQIRIHYDGIAGLSLADDGSLLVDLGGDWGHLSDDAPYIYQIIAGQQLAVAGRFTLIDSQTYAFEITGQYDLSRELVIDPDLAWASYLGGSSDEDGYGIAVDAAGNAYVTGGTGSNDFPTTPGAYDTTYGYGDDFVAKVTAAGSLAWASYLGRGNCRAIAVDTAGNAYVTGSTSYADFPTTAGAYDRTYNGPGSLADAFVAKLNPTGSSLVYSTYLGGSGSDEGCKIAVDAAGQAYVTGRTTGGFPTTAGTYDRTYNGGTFNPFVVTLNPAGSSLVYSTYLGATYTEEQPWVPSYAIAVDVAGNAYVTGVTTSADMPTTAGAYDTTYNGGYCDAFVAKLNAACSSLL